MPAPTYPIPTSPTPLQLYRHLLRECSYLPPAFAPTITQTIQHSFHKHHPHDPRPLAHLSRAKSALRTLRAANSGDKSAMEALISKGFGRSGSRRRELMARFVVPQGPSNSRTLETEMTPDSDPARLSKAAFYEKWDQQKLLRILHSQQAQQRDTNRGTVGWRSHAVKSVNPDSLIPAKTIWGRPPSEVLKRAKRASWWRRSAGKMLPPLGRGEWLLLQSLSRGGQETGEWAVPPRRTHVGEAAADTDTDTENTYGWRRYAEQPAAVVERPRSLSHQRRSGAKDRNPYGVGDRDRTLSPRWFRRAYNRAWQLTPTAAQDPNTLAHSFTWGRAEARMPPATRLQLQIFEGVDSQGQRKGT